MNKYVEQARFETVLDILMEHFRETETRMAELEKRIKELESEHGKERA